MNKLSKPVEGRPSEQRDKRSNPGAGDKQRGFGVVELLFAVTTIGAAILIAASRGPKLPPAASE